MAGAIPGFPAAAVREGLRLPMRMGLPVDPQQWPEFVIPAPVVKTDDVDEHGYPWDPTAPTVRPEPRRVRVVCALEPDDPEVVAENFGFRQPGVLVITLLDEEYRQVEGFDHVNVFPTIAGEPVRYHYRKVRQRLALDTVEVFQVEVSTEDMS